MSKTTHSKPQRRKHRQLGAVAVETAVVLPLALILVFGIIDFGLYFRSSIAFSSAVRSGARVGSADSRSPNMFADVTNAIAAEFPIPNVTIDKLYVYRVNRQPANGIKRGLAVNATTVANMTAGGCLTNCAIYTWNGSQFVQAAAPPFQFWGVTVSNYMGAWPVVDQYACAANGPQFAVPASTSVWTELPPQWGSGTTAAPAASATGGIDEIGVYLMGTYNFVTPLGNLIAGGFGTSRPITSRVTMKLEPVSLDTKCYK